MNVAIAIHSVAVIAPALRAEQLFFLIKANIGRRYTAQCSSLADQVVCICKGSSGHGDGRHQDSGHGRGSKTRGDAHGHAVG